MRNKFVGIDDKSATQTGRKQASDDDNLHSIYVGRFNLARPIDI